MADILWTDFRPRGLYSVETPVTVTEGALPIQETAVINEAALPTGYYNIQVGINWQQDQQKYMDFKFNVNGSPSQVYRLRTEFSDPIVTSFGTQVFLPVFGPMVIDLIYEFPDQAGAADGTVLGRQIAWEKWSEFPVA